MTIAPRGLRSIAAFLAVLCLIGLWPASVMADGPIVWEQRVSPPGGAIRALAQDPRDPQVIYAGTSHGLYRSADSGSAWTHLEQGALQCQEIGLLAVISSEVIYAGGREGLFRTTDAGASWVQLGQGLASNMLLSLAVQPTQPEVVYVGTDRGVFTSSDRGDRWQSASQGLPDGAVWSLVSPPWQPNLLFAGMDGGLYASTDAGASWQAASNGLPGDERVLALSADPREPPVLYAGTYQGLFRSADGGAQWVPVLMALGQDQPAEPLPVSALAFDPAQEKMLYANPGLNTVAVSEDGGTSWRELYAFEGGEAVLSIAPGTPADLYVGTSRGLVASHDGGETWTAGAPGIQAGDTLLLLPVPGSVGQLYAVTPQGIYRSEDGGATWTDNSQDLPLPAVLVLALDPADPRRLYAGASLAEMYYSADSGLHWNLAYGSGTGGVVDMHSVQDVSLTGLVACRTAQDANAPLVLYAATESSGVWRSNDAGQTWEPLAQGLPELHTDALALVSGEHPMVYVATGGELYSLDVGPDQAAMPAWQRVNALPFNGNVTQILPDPTRPGTLYISTDQGNIYRSMEDGLPWQNLTEGVLPADRGVERLALMPRKGKPPLLCALVQGSLLYTQDEGVTWSLLGEECLYGATIHSLITDDSTPDALYLGTSKGIYRGRFPAPPGSPWARVVLLVTLCVALSSGGIFAYTRWRRGGSRLQRDLLDQNWELWDRIMGETLAGHECITPDLLTSIPVQVRIMAMRRYLDRHRDQNLIFREEPPTIEPANRTPLHLFDERWSSLTAHLGDIVTARPIAASLTEQLCELLGFVPLESRVFKSLFGYMINAPVFRLSIPPRFPIIFMLNADPSAGDIRDVRTLMGVFNVTSFFALLVTVDATPEGRERSKELKKLVHNGADDFIVLDYQDLRSLFLAVDVEHRLIEMILKQVDLTVVSPYVISGPVPEYMFFGRDYELKAIMRTVRDKSYAIVGGRKIGKTSVLNKILRLMEQTSGFQPYYLDCQHVTNYEEFFGAVAVKCQVQVEAAVPDVLRRIVLRLQRQNGPGMVILLLDEVDRLLQYDIQHQTRLFRMFRTLSQEGLCRFVLCGERQLNGALHDADSPLFNFASIMRLSYLSVRDALRVVQEPMTTMGVLFEDRETLPPKVVELSSCHPNIVQAICQMLIVRTNARNDRLIRYSDLQEVRSSDDFREFFFEVAWGNATTLERLISVLMADSPAFALAEVRQVLADRGCDVPNSAIEAALEGLVLFSLLQRQGGTYSFATRSFPTILGESGLAEGLFIDGLLEKLHSEEFSSSATPSQK